MFENHMGLFESPVFIGFEDKSILIDLWGGICPCEIRSGTFVDNTTAAGVGLVFAPSASISKACHKLVILVVVISIIAPIEYFSSIHKSGNRHGRRLPTWVSD